MTWEVVLAVGEGVGGRLATLGSSRAFFADVLNAEGEEALELHLETIAGLADLRSEREGEQWDGGGERRRWR